MAGTTGGHQSNTQATSQLKHFINGIAIIFWNARSIDKNKDELGKLLEGIDIFVCVESYLTPKKPFHVSGFNSYRKDRVDRPGGGILILARKNLSITILDDIISPDPSVEMFGIKINNLIPVSNIVACYRCPNFNISLPQDTWDNIFNVACKHLPVIFVGDFNAHNEIWNCTDTNTNGRRMYNSVINSELIIHNQQTLTHFSVQNNTFSNIDLIMSNSNISNLISVETLEESLSSDHFPVLIEFNAKRNIYRKKSSRLSSKKTNWTTFSTEMQESFQYFLGAEYSNLNPIEQYKKFVEIISNTIVACTPLKKDVPDCIHRNPVSWWDSDCDRVKRIRNAANKKWKHTKNRIDYYNYKKACANAKKLFKKKRKENFSNFCEKINFNTDPSYVWHTSKVLKNKFCKSKTTNLSPEAKIELIKENINKIAPPWVPTNPEYMPSGQPTSPIDNPFTLQELNIALESCSFNSSPGHDGIDYQALYFLPLNIKCIMLDIYNSLYHNNTYPQEWNIYNTFFIKKPDGSGYRPISLSSCILKLFEKMIKNRLQFWIEKNNLLPKSQSGFRCGRSCSDNLSSLYLNILEDFRNNRESHCAFLDVQGAFDNINTDILLEKLSAACCSTKIIAFVKALTRERVINFNANTPYQTSRITGKGLPQGGVLSPLLYLIYVRHIVEGLDEKCRIYQFADDISVQVSERDSNVAVAKLEESINIIKNNLLEIGLQLSPSKTKYIHFNKKRIQPGLSSFLIDNFPVVSTKSARFLGITFDFDLQFNDHINNIHKKCFQAMNIIKFVRGTWWGADPLTLLILYKSLIRSKLEYNSFIYFPHRKDTKLKLERIQFAAIRLAFGYRISTPTNILLGESKLTSIEDRAIMLGKRYYAKVLSNTNLNSFVPVQNVMCNSVLYLKPKKIPLSIKAIIELQEIAPIISSLSGFSIFHTNFEALTSEIDCDMLSGINFKNPNSANSLFEEYCNSFCDNYIKIYTDGSKTHNNSSVGVGILCQQLDFSSNISLHPQASIFTAECFAIYCALNIILNKPNNYLICSDSLSALQAIFNCKFSAKYNKYVVDIRTKLYNFHNLYKDKYRIKLLWIPSHVGIAGNEMVDIIAKEATTNAPASRIKIPFSDFYQKFSIEAKKNTQKKIKEEAGQKGIFYFNNYFKESNKPWFCKLNLKRDFITWVNRCRANHYHLAESLERKNFISEKKCKCDFDTQDLNHVIWDCPLLEKHRTQMITDLERQKHIPPYSISDFLIGPDVKALKIIFNYLGLHKYTNI